MSAVAPLLPDFFSVDEPFEVSGFPPCSAGEAVSPRGTAGFSADFSVDFTGASVQGGQFEGADLREVDLGGLQPGNLALFKGATISVRQAVALVAALGLQVA